MGRPLSATLARDIADLNVRIRLLSDRAGSEGRIAQLQEWRDRAREAYDRAIKREADQPAAQAQRSLL